MDEQTIERLRSQGFRVNKMTTDDLRSYLKSKGWKRRDRASGPNESRELWIAPWDGVGYEPLGISLKAAVRRQLKNDGYIAS